MVSIARLRIAMVAACPFPWPRGTPARILGLARALARAGHDVHVVAYPLGEPSTPLGFPVHRTAKLPGYRRTAPGPDPAKLLFLDPLLAALTARIVKRFRIDLVHAHHYEGLLAALPARRISGVPVIYDAHTTLAGELPYYRFGVPRRLIARLGAWLDQRLPPLADHVIATTDDIAAQLRAGGLRSGRISVLGNGIEDDFEVTRDPSVAAESEVERIVYAGNLAGYQGIDALLKAFACIAAARPHAQLVLITGSGFEAYEAEARRLGIRHRIELQRAPPPRELGCKLACAAVLVNPRLESPGYPHKLINYMAAGRPIVSFASSGRGLRHGVDAWLVDDLTPTGLAAGILEVLSRPELRGGLGAAAQEQVFGHMTWPHLGAQLERIYASVLEASAAAVATKRGPPVNGLDDELGRRRAAIARSRAHEPQQWRDGVSRDEDADPKRAADPADHRRRQRVGG